MDRRSFVSGLGSVLAALQCRSSCARDNAAKTARMVMVSASYRDSAPKALAAFYSRLRELGYVEGQNLIVERYWADGQLSRLPALMEAAVAHHVDVIFTTGTPAALAAKQAT